jgi:RHS repeat-associated protein
MSKNIMGIDPFNSENNEIFNTTSKKSTGVDARTGLFEAYVPLPTITCNMGLGPAIDMSLSYTPMVDNRAGLGDGWSFAFTTYNEAINQLRLHSGEAITVEKDKDLPGPLVIAYWAADHTALTVKRPDGRVEVLKRAGVSQVFVPVSISQDGKSFATLVWEAKERVLDDTVHYQIRLISIADTAPAQNAAQDEVRVHVRLQYAADDADIQEIGIGFWESCAPLACTYALTLNDYALTTVTLPEGHQYTFSYDDHAQCGYLLAALTTPEGLTETVTYKDNGLTFLNDSKLSSLPCVAIHATTPANEAAKVIKQYSYIKEEWYLLSAKQISGLAEYLGTEEAQENEAVGLFYFWLETGELATPDSYLNLLDLADAYHYKKLQGALKDLVKLYRVNRPLPGMAYFEEAIPELKYSFCILALVDQFGIDFKLQSAYRTIIQCASHVETIYFGVDHQTLMTSIHNLSNSGDIARTFYTYEDGSISKRNFINGQLQTETRSEFNGALIVKRSCPQETKEWTYFTDSHTVEKKGDDGYSFIPSKIATERTVYPDGTSMSARFTYNTIDSRPATRKQFFSDDSQWIEQRYRYDHRGLAELTTEHSTGHQSHKTVSHSLSGFALTTTTTERLGTITRETTQTYHVLNGRLISETDADGNCSTFDYDAYGRLTQRTTCAQNIEFREATLYQHPSASRVEVIEPNGVRRAYDYDGRGNVVKEHLAAPASNNQAVVWKLVKAAEFDNSGRPSATLNYDYLPHVDGEQIVTQRCEHEYDCWGNAAVQRFSTGEVVVNSYDPKQHMRVERQGAPDELHGKFTYYNTDDTVKKVEWRDATGTLKKIEGFNYCGPGLVSKHVTLDGNAYHVAIHDYDAIGRLCGTRHYIDEFRCWSDDNFKDYLSEFLSTSHRFGSSGSSKYAEYRYTYPDDLLATESTRVTLNYYTLGKRTFDDAGRLTTLSRDGYTETFSYQDDSLVPTSKVTADGKILTYTYIKELGNRVASIKEKTTSLTQHFTYATASKPTSLAAEENQHVRFTHDPYGGVTRLETQFKPSVVPASAKPETPKTIKITVYKRSLAGRLLSEDDASGGTTVFDYDEHGRRSTAKHLHAGGSELSELHSSYSTSGQLAHETLSVSKCTKTTSRLSHPLSTYYKYDTEGREIERTFKTHKGELGVTRGYDTHGRLTRTQLTQDGKVLGERTLRYNLQGKLASCSTSGVWQPTANGKTIEKQAFTYDVLGNISHCTTQFASSPSVTSTFSYSGTRLLEVKHSDESLGSSGKLSYDNAGRVIKDHTGKTYEYDVLGRRVKAGSKRYTYDPLSRLMTSGNGQDQNLIIYDDLTVRGEYAVNSSAMRHCCLEGVGISVICRVNVGVKRFLAQLKDFNGTVLITYDLTADTLAHHAYTAYGKQSSSESEALAGFNGEYRDADTDQYPLGNGYRWYVPETMCFYSQDSLSPFDEGGVHTYGYCDGDPVNRQDPSGHFWVGLIPQGISLFTSYLFSNEVHKGLANVVGEKAANIISTVFWAGLGVATAIATGGLSLWLTAAIIGLSLVAFATAVASVAIEDTDPNTAEILGWVSFATTIAAGGASGLRKAGMFAMKSLRKLSTKLGNRSGKCLEHLLNTAGGAASKYRPAVTPQLRSEIAMQEIGQRRGSFAALEHLVDDLNAPLHQPQPSWKALGQIFDSGDANTLACTVTGLLGMTNTFSDSLDDINGQVNNDTWLPWGNWDGFAKRYPVWRLFRAR